MSGTETEHQLKVLVKDDTGTHEVWQRTGLQGPDWLYGSVTFLSPRQNSIQVNNFTSLKLHFYLNLTVEK